MRLKKIIEAAEAVAVIHNGDTVASSGYAGSGTPDQLFVSLEQRFLESGTPRDLTSGAFLRHKLGAELAKRELSSTLLDSGMWPTASR